LYRFLLSFSLVLLLSFLSGGFAESAAMLSYERVSAENVNREIAPLLNGLPGGVVVGFTNGKEHKVYGFGSCTEGKEIRPDGKTLFELGSLTKVFTGILIADFQRESNLSIDEPVRKYLPAGFPVPEMNGRQITLFQLATHSSGMPRNPDNLEQFVKYGKVQFQQFMGRCKLESIPGRKYSYSNAAYTLIGEVLENLGGKPYEELLSERILIPLQMNNTRIVLKEDEIVQLAQSFGKDGQAIAASPRSGGAAGGLKSCADDLLKLMDAAIERNGSNISCDIQETLKRRFQISRNEAACLGCFRNVSQDTYGKLGQIHGFSSAMEFSISNRIGVVVLSSTLQAEAPALLQRCAQLIYGGKRSASLR
jgi:D-alanyl-D-alanine-carboxypeptidase/D-alanyl-D-alanine-endopeptidase